MRLEIKDLHVFYGKIEAIKGISVVVNQGEIVTLIGANGAGKTTTLKTISGLRPVASGSITFDGQDISKMQAHDRVALGISQAPEGRGIFPGMSVLENLEIGKYFRKDRKHEMKEDLEKVYHLFPRLKERAFQAGGTLSGGEQQMLAIGRSLMARPKVLLLDEPFGALDEILRRTMNLELQRIWSARRPTTILVTHSIEEAIFLADKVAVMSARPGRIAEIVDVPFERPRDPEIMRSSEFHKLADHLSELLFAGGGH